MKIGIVCPHNYYRHGGVQEHVRAQASELMRRGHAVRVIVPRTKEAEAAQEEHVIALGQSTHINALSTNTSVAASIDGEEVESMLEREQFDVIHFHEPWVPLLSRQILSRSSALHVATFHAKLPDTYVSKSLEKVVVPYTKSVLKYIHYLTAVSNAAAEYVSSLTDMPIQIVPNGLPLKQFDPAAVEPLPEYMDKPSILFIGRLEKRKGVEYLLEAYHHLTLMEPDVRLLIAGNGAREKQLRNYAGKFGLEDVHFLGFVSEEEKLRLLRTATLFCSPALYGESFGIVLLEAMAMGVPVVAGNNPGYRCVLSGRGRMSLVDPEDTESFVDKLQLMLGDPELRTLMIDWGREAVKAYDYEVIVGQYEAVYERLAKG